MAKKKADDKALAAPPKPNVAMTSTGLMATNIDDGYRFAQMISRSRLVPENYQGQPDNCLVAIDLSLRWGVSWLVVMQHVYMVHDRPALDAALCIALTNKSGIFDGPLEYEVEGDDARKDDFRVRAYATRTSNGNVLKGPWIDWQLVRGEGWDQRKGSKWKSMPDQMFHYRAASWFQRRFCPEVSMGMLTSDEAEEAGPKHVESSVVEKGVQGLKDRLQERDAEQDTTEPVKGEEVDDDTAAEVARQKAALKEAVEQEDVGGDDAAETEDEATPDEPALSGDTASIFD